MVKAVDHTGTSSAATTGWESVKGALTGAVVPILIGAALIGGAAYLAGAVLTGGAASWFAGLSVAGKMGVIGASAGAVYAAGYSAIGAAIGAVVGLTRGAKRVGEEQSKFSERAGTREQIVEAKMAQAQMSGAQMGYERGVYDAQMAMAEKIREAQYAQIQQQMAAAHEQHCKPCNKHVTAELERRNAAAATGAQVVR